MKKGVASKKSLIYNHKVKSDKELSISQRDAAASLGISTATLYNWIRQGMIRKTGRGKVSLTDLQKLSKELSEGSLNRLNRMANRRHHHRRGQQLIPVEDPELRDSFFRLIEVLESSPLTYKQAITLCILSFLQQKGEWTSKDSGDFSCKLFFSGAVLWRRTFLGDWIRQHCPVLPQLNSLPLSEIQNLLEELRPFHSVLNHPDSFGLLYQALRTLGDQSDGGAWYTPQGLVGQVLDPLFDCGQDPRREVTFYDPCCGSGQFLLRAAHHYRDPSGIYGCDLDPFALFLTGINLYLHFPDWDGPLNLYCGDSLINEADNPFGSLTFNIIASNPPWGSRNAADRRKLYGNRYPAITSGESFSWFTAMAAERLKPEGRLLYLLPESALKTAVHRDFRSLLAGRFRLERIRSLGTPFHKVMSKVIALEATRQDSGSSEIDSFEYCGAKASYRQSMDPVALARGAALEIGISPEERAILDRIYSIPHQTFKENSSWALGIVTGNNRKWIDSSGDAMGEPLITGKMVGYGRLLPGKSKIQFEPARFQQCARESLYRASPKLVYRFISNRPIFAVDYSGAVTLNSANVLIPGEGLPSPESLTVILNSSVINFVYTRRFGGRKVLKSHLQQLPIPSLSPVQERQLISFHKQLSHSSPGSKTEQELLSQIDLAVEKLFGLQPGEISEASR